VPDVDITVSLGPTLSRAQANAGAVTQGDGAQAGPVQGDGAQAGPVQGDGASAGATILSRRP
jgi:hypothetical protein